MIATPYRALVRAMLKDSPMLRVIAAAGSALVLFCGAAGAAALPPQAKAPEKVRIVEPQMHITRGGPGAPQVALTLDACMGKTDHRILDTLVKERIPATIFVTGRWLKLNAEAFAVMKAHPDLFQIEDHGAMHIPAVTSEPTVFGLRSAGSLDAVRAEIDGGTAAIEAAGGARPQWYRDATARYSTDAVKLIEQMGYRIAGYSLNGDIGASLPAPMVERRIAAARDGDVIISHINQPSRSAGGGVAKGVTDLKAKGVKFVLLKDVQTTLTLNPVPEHNHYARTAKPKRATIKPAITKPAAATTGQ